LAKKGRKTVNGIPLTKHVDETTRAQIRRASDPLKKALELEATTIKHVRKTLRGDPNKKLELALYAFVAGYTLLGLSLSQLVHLFI